jgi:autotransporter-associated beta strand protein
VVTLQSGSITGTTGSLTSTSTFQMQSGSVSAILAGSVGLNKSTAGTVTLTGNNTYSGTTTISAGTLAIGTGGSIASSSIIDVQSGTVLNVTGVEGFTVGSGQTLTGNGTISGATTVSGTLAPGASPGTLTFENALTLSGTTAMEIDGLAGAGVNPGGHDFINLTGAGAQGVLTYGGALSLDFGVLSAFGVGSYSWNLFDFASEAETFSSVSLAGFYSGSLLDGDANGVWELTSGVNQWTFTESTGVLGLTVVPEPGAALLGGLGLLALLRRRR